MSKIDEIKTFLDKDFNYVPEGSKNAFWELVSKYNEEDELIESTWNVLQLPKPESKSIIEVEVEPIWRMWDEDWFVEDSFALDEHSADEVSRLFKIVFNKVLKMMGHWITTKSGQRIFIKDRVSGLITLGKGVPASFKDQTAFIFNTLPIGFTRYVKAIELQPKIKSTIFPKARDLVGEADYITRTIRLSTYRMKKFGLFNYAMTHESAHMFWKFSKNRKALRLKMEFRKNLKLAKTPVNEYAESFKKKIVGGFPRDAAEEYAKESFAELSAIYRLRNRGDYRLDWERNKIWNPELVESFKALWDEAGLIREVTEFDMELVRQDSRIVEVLLNKTHNVVDNENDAYVRVIKEIRNGEMVRSAWDLLKPIKPIEEPKVVEVEVEPIWRDEELARLRKLPGVYLVKPHASMIADGTKTLIVKSKKFEKYLGQEVYFLEENHVYGILKLLTVEGPVPIGDVKEKLFKQHKILPEDWKKWWPKVKECYVYTFELVATFDPPKEVVKPHGIQVWWKEVKFVKRLNKEE